jgi:hypothetical protein
VAYPLRAGSDIVHAVPAGRSLAFSLALVAVSLIGRARLASSTVCSHQELEGTASVRWSTRRWFPRYFRVIVNQSTVYVTEPILASEFADLHDLPR